MAYIYITVLHTGKNVTEAKISSRRYFHYIIDCCSNADHSCKNSKSNSV